MTRNLHDIEERLRTAIKRRDPQIVLTLRQAELLLCSLRGSSLVLENQRLQAKLPTHTP